MTAQKGISVVLKVGNGATPTESFATIGGFQATRMTVSHRVVENTHRGSGLWRSLLAGAGANAVSIAGEGIFTDSAAEETLRAYAFAGSVNNYQLHFGNGDRLDGAFLMTRYERAGPHDAAETYQLALESAGAVTFVTA